MQRCESLRQRLVICIQRIESRPEPGISVLLRGDLLVPLINQLQHLFRPAWVGHNTLNVVTDLSLPGADGLAVLRAARQANASSYVVIVTGYASLDSAISAVRLGAYDYLTKPFSLGQLDVILRRIGDRASLERENRQLIHGETPARSAPALPDLSECLLRIEAALARIEDTIGSQELATSRRR